MTGARILALTGGVGGAKLARGMSQLVPPGDLTIVVNTGDDFEHLGLHISPDIDSVLYALAGVNDVVRGWGRADETWQFMETLRSLGGPDWFRIGDRDLAMHVARTQHLAGGTGLCKATAILAGKLGLGQRIAPMSNNPVRTKVLTAEGELDFQRYFVEKKCAPVVVGFRYQGADHALLSEVFAEALQSPRLEAVVLCPSNPFISIDPILAIPGVREALRSIAAPVVGVSPIVGGAAIKGPLGKMLAELGHEVSPVSIAQHYADLLDGFVLDESDRQHASAIASMGCSIRLAPAIMASEEKKVALASAALDLAANLKPAMAAVS